MEKKVDVGGNLLMGLGVALMALSLYLIFFYAPVEAVMGVVQKIFYFHVPSAWVAFLAFFVVFLGSILYLWKKDRKWDVLAHSSAEVGVIFTTLVLLTGPIWAKSAWGVWWTWDPRLTTTLILWLIYVAYLMVRSYAVSEAQGTRFAAVVGIVGFVNVPIVALAIVLWRTQHPGPLVWQEGGLDPAMRLTLMVSLLTFTVLYLNLLLRRMGLRRLKDSIEELRETLRD